MFADRIAALNAMREVWERIAKVNADNFDEDAVHVADAFCSLWWDRFAAAFEKPDFLPTTPPSAPSAGASRSRMPWTRRDDGQS